MLYTNKELTIKEGETAVGMVSGVTIGKRGRGRHEEFLPTPRCIQGEIRDFNLNLSIDTIKPEFPGIVLSDDNDLYMILSSERNYTRRGCGYIETPIDQSNEIITRGNGADGDGGCYGTWDVVILKAYNGDVFRVTWGGYGYGYPSTFYVVHDNRVFVADQPDVEKLYEKLDIDMPFNLEYAYSGDHLVIVPDEWKTI